MLNITHETKIKQLFYVLSQIECGKTLSKLDQWSNDLFDSNRTNLLILILKIYPLFMIRMNIYNLKHYVKGLELSVVNFYNYDMIMQKSTLLLFFYNKLVLIT